MAVDGLIQGAFVLDLGALRPRTKLVVLLLASATDSELISITCTSLGGEERAGDFGSWDKGQCSLPTDVQGTFVLDLGAPAPGQSSWCCCSRPQLTRS